MSFLYREAGRILQAVEDGRSSLKTLTLGRANSVGGGKGGDENGPKRKLYAMVSETLRYKPLLDRLVAKADPKGNLFSDEHMREKAQGYIMLYEMLLGKGAIQGGGKLKRHLMQYKPRLDECLAEAKVAEGLRADASNESLLPRSARRHIFPRYARVNLVTCAEGAQGVAETLQKEGFAVKIDDVVPSLLVLPAGTDLHDHAMVKDGRLVLQDKSSCFSAEALLGEEACVHAAAKDAGIEWRGGDVIDACAAPGNKTMHAASLLYQQATVDGSPAGRRVNNGTSTSGGEVYKNNKKRGKVFAFDKDMRRLALMRRRVDESGSSAGGAVETRLQDFLQVDPFDPRYSKVTAILLDPSCSGSGIVSSPDRLHENETEGDEKGPEGGDTTRLGRLASFQLQGLLKAMSFPQVQRVCYSTCSVHVEENEDVVAKALEQQPTAPSATAGTFEAGANSGADTASKRFKLSPCLSRWPRRGLTCSGLDENQAACLVRTDASEDETNGFFVAMFEREGSRSGGSSSDATCIGVTAVEGEPTKEATPKKKRNRHKNRTKNRKKRKREQQESNASKTGADDGGVEGAHESPSSVSN